MAELSAASSSEKPSDTFRHLSMRVGRGMAIPSQMLSPGEDGYRTPTIEDYEQDCRQKDHQSGHYGGLAHQPARMYNLHASSSATRSHFSLSKGLENLAWKQRLRHFTWSFFTMTMATGGIANVLHTVPFRFPGLDIIGTIFFLFNVFLFIVNSVLISLRFYLFPETFRASFLHPTESLFAPAAVVSFGTILINISQYGLYKVGSWLNTIVLVLFWIDVVLAMLASSGIYLLMWSTQTFTISAMTPIWIFPAYPLLIIGPHAGVLSAALNQERALDIIVGGFTLQGIGYLVSLTINSAFIYRLMTQKLPRESLRPGMFVSVGPNGFTASGIITMAGNAQKAFPAGFMGNGALAAMIVKVVADWVALWVWGLAIWFFIVSVGAHRSCIGSRGFTFSMTWFSFVFPNTALVTATFAVGDAFDSVVIQIVGCVMTCILIIVWIVVFGMMIRAIKLKHILWPQKGEDKDEGGFRIADTRRRTQSSPAIPKAASIDLV